MKPLCFASIRQVALRLRVIEIWRDLMGASKEKPARLGVKLSSGRLTNLPPALIASSRPNEHLRIDWRLWGKDRDWSALHERGVTLSTIPPIRIPWPPREPCTYPVHVGTYPRLSACGAHSRHLRLVVARVRTSGKNAEPMFVARRIAISRTQARSAAWWTRSRPL